MVAVVTGGNGGLGQRICHALAAEGCHIAVVYAQSKDQAAGVARDLEKHQVGAAAFACDVTQRDQVQRLVDDVVKRFGRLDILVNDAAYNKSIPFTDLDNLTYEEWTKIIDINLTGPCSSPRPWPGHEAAGQRADRQHLLGRGTWPDRFVDRLCRFQGGSDPSHQVHGRGAGARGAGELRGARPARGHARDGEPRPEQVAIGRKASLLGKAADKDDVADQVVTMCRTNTMTGQTLVIDSGRTFH